MTRRGRICVAAVASLAVLGGGSALVSAEIAEPDRTEQRPPERPAEPARTEAAPTPEIEAPAPTSPPRRTPSRPNVIVVMTDDQTVADLETMPQTRRLIAGEGVSFDRSYVSYPVCCPSRATYLTGQYAHNHGVLGLYPPTGGYGRLPKRRTLPVWLNRAGYRTAHVGKFLNGYGSDEPADVPPGWDEWYGSVDPTTYRMWGYTLNENGRMVTYGRPDARDPGLYQTDVLRDRALDFIRRGSAGSRPFFLSLAFVAPHHERDAVQAFSKRVIRPAPRHDGRFANLPLPTPRSFDEPDLRDKPTFLREKSPPLTPRTVAQIGENFRSRRESLLAVDEAVAAIVAQLRASRTLQDTYIVFTSDNGFLQGEHRVPSGKVLPYEPSSAVPLLIRGPGIPHGARSRELVMNTDLTPTIMRLARARTDEAIDGRSLLEFARNPRLRSRRYLLHETGAIGPAADRDLDAGPLGVPPTVTYQALRTARYLYVRYWNGERELYDRARDPDELDSRAGTRPYRRTQRALDRELLRLTACRGRSCRAPGRPVPPPRRARRAG